MLVFYGQTVSKLWLLRAVNTIPFSKYIVFIFFKVNSNGHFTVIPIRIVFDERFRANGARYSNYSLRNIKFSIEAAYDQSTAQSQPRSSQKESICCHPYLLTLLRRDSYQTYQSIQFIYHVTWFKDFTSSYCLVGDNMTAFGRFIE